MQFSSDWSEKEKAVSGAARVLKPIYHSRNDGLVYRDVASRRVCSELIFTGGNHMCSLTKTKWRHLCLRDTFSTTSANYVCRDSMYMKSFRHVTFRIAKYQMSDYSHLLQTILEWEHSFDMNKYRPVIRNVFNKLLKMNTAKWNPNYFPVFHALASFCSSLLFFFRN